MYSGYYSRHQRVLLMEKKIGGLISLASAP
jgi:hypothetical protein